MNKLYLLTSAILIASLGLTGCGDDDNSSTTVKPSTPKVNNPESTTQKQLVTGTISDTNGNPLSNATIRVGDKEVASNTNGKYSLDLNDTDTDFTVLVKRDGYLTTARQIKLLSKGTYKVDINLSADQVTTEFDNSSGINKLSVSGATVTIPRNAVVKADGTTYNGNVKIAANYYNPDSVEGAQAFAQPYIGQDADGSDETGLVTVGVVDVKLTDPATGDKLNLKEGASATLTFPEASTDQNLPAIPLWYYDEEDMVWVKDGEATRQADGSYKGQVSHFTLWNLDIPVLEYSALVKGCFIYEDTNEPIAGGIDAVIKGRGFMNMGGVDNEGKFSAQVPINTPLTLSSYYNNNGFNPVNIPALEQDTVYEINDGNCISANDTRVDNIFTYVDVFEELPPSPVIVTPDPQPKPPTDPIDPPSTSTEAGLIGHSFYFDEDYSDDTGYVLSDVELDTYRTTSNNTLELIEQSLYGKTDYGIEGYPTTSFLALTTNGLEPQSQLSVINDGSLFKVVSFKTTFNNNVLSQQLDNGLNAQMTLKDVSLSNQKIGDVLALENVDDINSGSSYLDVPMTVINNLNGLPNQLSVFDSNATCKKIVSLSDGNVDHIRFLNVSNTFNESIDFENPNLESPFRGTWAGIPWVASTIRDEYESDVSDAYVEYDGKVYVGDYYWAGDTNLTTAEKDECFLYNEAAKEQIFDALKEAYPAL